MNFRLFTGLAAIVCVSLASCVPYNEAAKKKKVTKGAEKTVTSPDATKAKQEESKKKAVEEEMKKKEESTTTNTGETSGGTTPPTEAPKLPEPKRNDYQFANKVPGKDGFVFSPYNNKVVDVRDIPSGTLVQDPTYPASEKKFFRVP